MTLSDRQVKRKLLYQAKVQMGQAGLSKNRQWSGNFHTEYHRLSQRSLRGLTGVLDVMQEIRGPEEVKKQVTHKESITGVSIVREIRPQGTCQSSNLTGERVYIDTRGGLHAGVTHEVD